MKEAAGEANLTIITIVLITIVVGAGGLIVSGLLNTVELKAACSDMGGKYVKGNGTFTGKNGSSRDSTGTCVDDNGTVLCYVYKTDSGSTACYTGGANGTNAWYH